MSKKILPIILFVSFQLSMLLGQGITITYDDYMSFYSVGATDKGFATPMMDIVQVNVGSASGTSQVWDFSQLTYEKVQDGVFVEPGTSPSISSFPEANIVQKVNAYGFDSYTYHKLDATGFYMLGVGGDLAIPDVIYETGVCNFEFPVTYSKTWEDNTVSNVMGFTNQIHYKWTADAFGTIKLPHGDFAALRVSIEITTVSDYGMGQVTSKSYMISFVTEGVESVYISAEEPISEGEISTQGLIYMAPGNITNLDDEQENIPVRFELAQNYPNPFNPTTTIEFEVAAQEPNTYATLKVYDVLGNEVATLYNGSIQAGVYETKFDASGLSSGTYLYMLKSNQFKLIKKCLLIK